MIWVLRLYLSLNLLVFWGYTVAFFVAPKRLAEGIGIALVSTTGIADFRAMYGGMCLGVGAVFALGLSRDRWRAPAVFLAGGTAGGLFLGRALTLATDGAATPYIYQAMISEVVTVAMAAWLLRSPVTRATS
jgi:hypothetical protein